MLKRMIARRTFRVLLAITLVAGATAPGKAATGVIGSVAGSINASIDGQALLPSTTIFSGDKLQVHDGVAVIGIGTNNRMIFGRDTAASFLRDTTQVTVSLSQGNLTILHLVAGTPLRIKAEKVVISPVSSLRTLGDIAVLSGSVVITAKEGTLQVEDHGVTKECCEGSDDRH
jgi:phosphohistidine swiveling domain-containing protein